MKHTRNRREHGDGRHRADATARGPCESPRWRVSTVYIPERTGARAGPEPIGTVPILRLRTFLRSGSAIGTILVLVGGLHPFVRLEDGHLGGDDVGPVTTMHLRILAVWCPTCLSSSSLPRGELDLDAVAHLEVGQRALLLLGLRRGSGRSLVFSAALARALANLRLRRQPDDVNVVMLAIGMARLVGASGRPRCAPLPRLPTSWDIRPPS